MKNRNTGMLEYWNLVKNHPPRADQKRPDARHPTFRGVRRTYQYAATTRNKGNAADGRFSSAR
jgi:hypothetical protein